jgi:hypothetical protein
MLGFLKKKLNCFEKSLEYPRNLDIGQNNREGQANYFIGLVYLKSGKKKQAKNYFERSVSMKFNSKR